MGIICPNPLCRKEGCYQHCNHCSADILWRPPLLDREIAYNGPKPLEMDGKKVHRCMRDGTKDGRFYKTEPLSVQREEENWNKRKGYTGPTPHAGIHLGVSHLWVEGEFLRLYKCPLCNFQNIHKEVINHHIFYAYDERHNKSGIII